MKNIYLLHFVLNVNKFFLRLKTGEKKNNDLPDAFDFSIVILTTLKRSNHLCCSLICEIARLNTIGTSQE